MSISLTRDNVHISNEDIDGKDFLKYVKIKVEYKSFLKSLIKGTIYDGDLAGLIDGKDCSIKIGKDKFIELKYSITMDEQAMNNIENISSSIDFTINISEAELENIG